MSLQSATLEPSLAHALVPFEASLSDARIPVADLVSALSFALDLTEDAVPGHSIRTCLLSMRLAQAIGLSDEERSSLFYAALLKDIGCSSNAARLCQVMGTDERKVKSAVKFVDWTRPTLAGVRTAWQHLDPEASAASRMVRMLGLGFQQQENNREMITLRCDRGASILRRIGLPQSTCAAVRHLDEHWDGSGFPGMLTGEQIPLLSRILLIAQHLDVFEKGRGAAAAIETLKQRSGRWFDPGLVRAASTLDQHKLLWSSLNEQDLRSAVLDLEPGQKLVASDAQLDEICFAFADVVDVKSTFTGSHSRGVAKAAVLMAETLGFTPDRVSFIARASLLHDLGKLRVPNSILDKQAPLTAAEFDIVREHPALTGQVLSRVSSFAELATVASQHHERLDGSGYPFKLQAPHLSLESRVIAVADVYAALAENRPYRAGLAMPQIRRVMDQAAGSKLDSACYDALLSGLEQAKSEHLAVA